MRLLAAAVLSLCIWAPSLAAQTSFGRNLVVNGDAEAGSAVVDRTLVVSAIPGWTRTGSADVLFYASADPVAGDDPAPVNRGPKYFNGGPGASSSSLSQTIDVSSSAAGIDSGAVTYDVSAYLGGSADTADTAKLLVSFLDSGGTSLLVVALGPVQNNDSNLNLSGLYFRRDIGLVPKATRRVSVLLTMTSAGGALNNASADNIVLILNTAGPLASVLGPNLIVNPDAESGPAVTDDQDVAVDIPGWSRSGRMEVEPWLANTDFPPSTPGPQNRGKALFTGGYGSSVSSGTQDIDVSPTAAKIDQGVVTYNLSAWLGGYLDQEDNASLTVEFLDWTGNHLGGTILAPVSASDRQNRTSLLFRSATGAVPGGTRKVHIVLTFVRMSGAYNDGYADNLSLTLSAPGRPAISQGGVVAALAFGGVAALAPGTWIEIYGSNLASTTRAWAAADFVGSQAPISLDGVSVSIGGQAAFVDYVSPAQVNAQVPDGISVGGPVLLTVSNASTGTSDSYSIVSNALQPALLVGVPAGPVKPGDTIVLYGIGFGPVNPPTPSGTIASSAASITAPIQVSFRTTPAVVPYAGLTPGSVGLYQFNVIVPEMPDNAAVPLNMTVGGQAISQSLFLSVHN